MNGIFQVGPFPGAPSAAFRGGILIQYQAREALNPTKPYAMSWIETLFVPSSTLDLSKDILADPDIQIPNRKRIQEPLVSVTERLKSMRNLRNNWDGFGSAAPNAMALRVACDVLLALHEDALSPTEIGPSVEEGVTVSFVNGDRYAFIEIYNDGDIAVGYFEGDNDPKTYEFDDSLEQIKQASLKVLEFING